MQLYYHYYLLYEFLHIWNLLILSFAYIFKGRKDIEVVET